MQKGVSPTIFRQGQTMASRRGVVPANHRSVRSPYQERRGNSPANFWKEQSSPTSAVFQNHLPNFVIELRSGHRVCSKAQVQGLITGCTSIPDKFFVFPSGRSFSGKLFFRQWSDALEAVVYFWERRLDGAHLLDPTLVSNVYVPSDMDEQRDRLKALFVTHVQGLLEGEAIRRWQKKLKDNSDEIATVSASLRGLHKVGAFSELLPRRNALYAERDLIANRIREFRAAMRCILAHLDGMQSQYCCDEGMEVFWFGDDFEWSQIHHLMLRECRRLEDGLPIYAFRQGILREIHCQQNFFNFTKVITN